MLENDRARAWLKHLGMTQRELADRTGYTALTINWFFKGLVPPNRNIKSGNAADRAIKEWVWRRFKRACGDVDAEIRGREAGQGFNW